MSHSITEKHQFYNMSYSIFNHFLLKSLIDGLQVDKHSGFRFYSIFFFQISFSVHVFLQVSQIQLVTAALSLQTEKSQRYATLFASARPQLG